MGNTLLTVSMAHRHTDSPGRTGPEPTTQPGKINLSRKLGLELLVKDWLDIGTSPSA
jgi:hypothetical protein